jgi:hypothetical protein
MLILTVLTFTAGTASNWQCASKILTKPNAHGNTIIGIQSDMTTKYY